MRSAPSDDLLEALLPSWNRRLQAWCLEGSFSTAARQALRLPEIPLALQTLVGQWAQGEFSALPPILLLSAAEMHGAAGAYATSRRTIVLNADWLLQASPAQVLAVLSEELGHHLDALINADDTPGDEGELFAALLDSAGGISAEQRDRLLAENDQGSVVVNGVELAVEQARVVSTPISVSSPGRTRSEHWNPNAFAALRADGSVVTWGDALRGGDSSGVARQLSSGVTQIFSTVGAFAALKSDGSVVTWGGSYSGNSSRVASRLSSGVRRIYSSDHDFAALKDDGSVVIWGDTSFSGYADSASALTSGVSRIFSTQNGFAALRVDGSVDVFGNYNAIYDSLDAIWRLRSGVIDIYTTQNAFAALKVDGSVMTWGPWWSGGDSSSVANQLSSGVQQIFATDSAFAALKADGSVITWGFQGGDSRAVADRLSSGVKEIFSTRSAFAALKSDGSVVTWGDEGGDSRAVADRLSSGVTKVFSNGSAFAALKSNGSVVTWGIHGGDSSGVAGQLRSGVMQVFSTDRAFAALKSNGSVVTWGFDNFGKTYGGDSTAVASEISSDVTQIFSTASAFAALKADGSVVTWGDPANGGSSGAVAKQLHNVVGFANPFTDDQLVTFADPLPPTITLSVSPADVQEDGNGALVYTFTRTGFVSSDLLVGYNVNGTASIGVDYIGIVTTGTIKTVAFAAGSSTATVTVKPISDRDIELDETVALKLVPSAEYIIDSTVAVVGTIDDDDDYTAGPSTIRGLNLGSTLFGYALAVADAEPIQVLYPYGYASPSNPGNGWLAVAAASTASGYALYWRTSNNGPTARWDLDARGVYTSGFLLSPFQLNREEAALSLDLNGDGYIAGPYTIDGVSLGSTSLGYALRHGSAMPLQVTFSGLNASANNPGDGWTAIAATTSSSGYALYWRNSSSGQIVRWQLNSSGAYSSGSVLSASQLISEEASLNLDLNDDGFIAVSLGSTPEGDVVLNTSPSSILVTDVDGHSSPSHRDHGWTALAVAVSGSGFALYWSQAASHQVERWNLRASGVYESADLLSPSELLTAEARLNLDLNGDGYTSGPSTMTGVNLGRTGEGYALRRGDAEPLQVTWPDGYASDSSPGQGWSAVAAKPLEDGYLFYWGNSISGQVARWQLDRSGSYQSGTFLSSSQLINEEIDLNADLNHDAIIGHVASIIENQGTASLACARDGSAIAGVGSGSYTVRSPLNLGVGDSGTEWQMLAAETEFRSGNRFVLGTTVGKILWRNNLGNFLHVWTLNNSWNWQSSSGTINPLSPDALGLETQFQLDLDGNGLIG